MRKERKIIKHQYTTEIFVTSRIGRHGNIFRPWTDRNINPIQSSCGSVERLFCQRVPE